MPTYTVFVHRKIPAQVEFLIGVRAAFIGLDADDDALIVVISAHEAADTLICGVQSVQQEIPVTTALPAPVDMEVAGSIVPVAHEGMSPGRSIPRIIHGATRFQLGAHHVVPLRHGIKVAVLGMYAGIVAEILREGLGDIHTIRATPRRVIIHIDGNTGMIHQRGHGIGLGLGVSAIYISRQHVIPRIFGSSEVGRQVASALCPMVTMRARATSRVLVVCHDLRHGSGHASRNGQVAIQHGAQVIERLILPPHNVAQQRRHFIRRPRQPGNGS